MSSTGSRPESSPARAPPPLSPQPAPAPAPAPAPPDRDPVNRDMPTTVGLKETAKKSLTLGAVTGSFGAAVGAGTGIWRASHPGIYPILFGVQWFAMGSAYSASRSLLWHVWGADQKPSPEDQVKAGTIAGGVSGMVGGMIRGPKAILPGVIVFSILGGATSYMSQRHQRNQRMPASERRGWLSQWSPVKRLPDKEYEQILAEKLLKVEAEIAIVDERIAEQKAYLPNPKEPEPDPKPAERSGFSNSVRNVFDRKE